MTDQQPAHGAHISAASEERFIASTEEFAAESSKATVIASMTIQALLVACVLALFSARGLSARGS